MKTNYLRIVCTILVSVFALAPFAVKAETPLDKTIAAIENADYTLNVYHINTLDGVYEYLDKYLRGFTHSNVELAGITVVDFEFAQTDTQDGSFSFFAELSYLNTRKTTETIDGTICGTPISVSISASQSSIFSGEECTVSAEISDYDGGRVYWYTSNNPNKNGTLLSEFKSTHITLSPSIGTKYFYCVYNGAVSNTVSVNVTEAFVPIADISLPDMILTCERSTPLTPEIFPENATKTDIIWKVTGGKASIISGRITARETGIITLKATVRGGGANGEDYEKFFEFYAEQGAIEYKEVRWSIASPTSNITQMTFTANEKEDIQITSVSDLTANKMMRTINAEDMGMIASAYVVCENISSIKKLTLQLDPEYSDKEVCVISADKDGNISSLNATVTGSAEIELPTGNVSYVITSEGAAKMDLSFLCLLLPVIPLMLIPVFSYVYKKRSEE